MISGASEEELIEAIGRADVLLEFMPKIKQLKQENEKLKDNWNKLKEYIDIKLYNVEYLQKLCGCRIDDEIHMILDIIKKEMQKLERSDSNDSNR